MQFVDKALARRFEAVEEMAQVFYARVLQKTRPEIGAQEQEICGGHMAFAGVGSPIGRATAAGLDREFGSGDLDQIEEFYRSHGLDNPRLCLKCAPETFAELIEREDIHAAPYVGRYKW